MKKLSIFAILSIISFSLFAQRIENVRFEQAGKMINIYYDLFESESGQRFEVKAYYSIDGGKTWTGPLNQVSGNSGEDQTAGFNKKIIWDVLWESDSLVGNVMFEVRAMPDRASVGTANSFIDNRDGRTYRYVTIGKQVWMAENLAFLPAIRPPSLGSEISPFYYVYNYYGTDLNGAKSTLNYETYGVLYNWPASRFCASGSDQGICPDGWHLPSDEEWKELEMFLGMSQNEADGKGSRGDGEGGKLKETGNNHWKKTNPGATNSTSYTALPAGYRNVDGWYNHIGKFAYFWSSTEDGSYGAWGRKLGYGSSGVDRNSSSKDNGFSVRCLRD